MTNLTLPYAFSAVTNLGQPHRLYQTTLGHKLSGFFAAALYFVFAVAFVFFVRPLILATQPESGREMFGLVTLLVPAGLLLFAAIQLLRPLFSNQHIVVYEHGLAFKSWRGLRQWAWADIQAIQANIIRYSYLGLVPMGTTHTYMVWTHKGDYLTLTQTIANVQALANDIEQATNPILLSQSVAAFENNRPVNFGPITLSRQGVKFNGKIYDWSQVANISIENGTINISQKGGGFFSGASLSAASVPNIKVLLALLQQIGGTVAIH